jgi:hypothetical protein
MEPKVDEQGNPILDQYSEEGFVDCVFLIRDLAETPDHYKFHLQASLSDSVLGMDVELVKNIKSGFNSDMSLINENVYRNGVTFKRSGEESDRLVVKLAQLYGLKIKPIKMVDIVSFTGIALHEGEINLESEPVKIKLFGNDSDTNTEDEYYESYFSIDLANGFVYWNEKDQEYRKPMIRDISQ